MEALAKQHNTLERACRKNTGGADLVEALGADLGRDSEEEEGEEEDEEENTEFFDAIAEHPEGFTLSVSRSRESLQSTNSEQSCGVGKEDLHPVVTRATSDQSLSVVDSKDCKVISDVACAVKPGLPSTENKKGIDFSCNNASNDGLDKKIVTSPHTVKGSFGVNVSKTVGDACFFYSPIKFSSQFFCKLIMEMFSLNIEPPQYGFKSATAQQL